jgi:aminodeoxyfutalosine deaminase
MNPPANQPKTSILRIHARAIIDPVDGERGCCFLAERVEKLSLPPAPPSPQARNAPNRLHASWRVLALGSEEEVSHHPAAAAAERLDLSDSVILPGLVNAHTHLDLTHIGPQPHDPQDGFVSWVEMVLRSRARDEQDIRASVQRGIDLLLKGGTIAVGDIAGSSQGRYTLAPWRALSESPLAGVSYIECFGMGRNEESSRSALQHFIDAHEHAFAAQHQPVRLGLQPHAPNTVALSHYRWILALARRLGAPICTHLAETPEERQFIATGSGPQRTLLERLDLWNDAILAQIARNQHPVAHLEPILTSALQPSGTSPNPRSKIRFLAAHVNDATSEAIEILARTQTSVAYCPRASEYFGAHLHFGPHRYREMLQAGINVCLGTDSIVNLSPSEVDRSGMSILDEMRLLHRRDSTDPMTLLRMATSNGARALALDPDLWRITPGELAGDLVVIKVPESTTARSALAAALAGNHPPQLLSARP